MPQYGHLRKGVMNENHAIKDPKPTAGFTLLEVIISIAILSFGLLAVAAMQVGAINGNSIAYKLTERTTLAQDKMEELMGLSYTDDDIKDDDITVGVTTTHTEPNPPKHYTITWIVDDDTPVTNSKTITVRVTLKEKGVTKMSSFTSVKPKL
jgi:type IV pilus assembly protein PilV